MSAPVVLLGVVVAWLLVSLVILALCRAAAHGDRQLSEQQPQRLTYPTAAERHARTAKTAPANRRRAQRRSLHDTGRSRSAGA